MPKSIVDPAAAIRGTSYPSPFDEPCRGRTSWTLTRQLQLDQFGVNLVHLAPGSWSTQKHWHTRCDEVVIVISGEITIVTDELEETVRAGECYSFKAGVRVAHHIQNRGTDVAIFYDVGGRDLRDISTFPDMGMVAKPEVKVTFTPIRAKSA